MLSSKAKEKTLVDNNTKYIHRQILCTHTVSISKLRNYLKHSLKENTLGMEPPERNNGNGPMVLV